MTANAALMSFGSVEMGALAHAYHTPKGLGKVEVQSHCILLAVKYHFKKRRAV